MMESFGKFLICETRAYLGQRVGDVLTALQSLSDDAPSLGTRQLTNAAEAVVKQIRRILHDRWSDEDTPVLKSLQKVGVALMRGVNTNEPLPEILATATQELETSITNLKQPVNSLATPDEA